MNNGQRDPRWANILIGDGTIGMYGCTVTVLGDILGLTPDVVVAKLKAVQGFLNNAIIWDKISQAFPGITVRRVWSYDNDDVLANVPNVIVEVPAAPIGGTDSHWVNYLGNQQLKDPWTPTIRPTSDFPNPTGYAVITGSIQGGGNVPDTISAKSGEEDKIVSYLYQIGSLTSDNSDSYLNDEPLNAIKALKVDRDKQAALADKFNKVCVAVGLTGDSNQIAVQDVLNKMEGQSASQKLQQIETILKS